MTTHTLPWKTKELAELTELIKNQPVVAVADLSNFPAPQFQGIRKKLKGKAIVKVSKTRVIIKAMEDAGKKELSEFANGSCGLIFTEMNPFELYAFLKKNKGNAPAKAGAIAPEDIVILAGDTGLPPGPALSDLKAAGLKVKIAGATIEITEDKIVTHKGEVVSPAVAGTLSKLDIKPIKVGLNVVAALENGEIFRQDVLDIDIDEVFGKFVKAQASSFNLAMEIRHFSPRTTPLLVQKAFNNAKAVALEANVFTKETMPLLLAKANAQASALKEMIPESAPAEEKKEVAEEKKEEEKKDA
ncbi:MAG: 50S ribosomal protein L10 [Candidatus Diapherotrites archaeon]